MTAFAAAWHPRHAAAVLQTRWRGAGKTQGTPMNDRAENTLLVMPGLLLLALAFFVPITQMLILSVSGDDGRHSPISPVSWVTPIISTCCGAPCDCPS